MTCRALQITVNNRRYLTFDRRIFVFNDHLDQLNIFTLAYFVTCESESESVTERESSRIKIETKPNARWKKAIGTN